MKITGVTICDNKYLKVHVKFKKKSLSYDFDQKEVKGQPVQAMRVLQLNSACAKLYY